MIRAAAVALALAGAIAVANACSPATPRDTVPETHDVHVERDAQAASSGGGYAYVARRAHGVVALAGTKNIDADEARRIVDRLADELDACARGLQTTGALVDGAARFVLAGLATGATVTDMQLESGGAVAQNALLCLVAPAKAIPMSPLADGGVPSILLESTWSPVQTGKTTVSREAGGP